MPAHDIDPAEIIAGVERAIVKLLTAPDIDGAFYDAVRQGSAMQFGRSPLNLTSICRPLVRTDAHRA